MSSVASASERQFVVDGLRLGVRADGRELLEVRPVTLEAGVLPSTAGSARCVRARGQTDVLVGVKADLVLNTQEPSSLAFTVECAATASPDFKGRGGSVPSAELVQALNQFYRHFSFPSHTVNGAMDTTDELDETVAPQWAINVDVVVLQSTGGSLLDVISLAVRTALLDARLPQVRIILGDEGRFGGVQLPAEGIESQHQLEHIPGADQAPVCVTIHTVDDQNTRLKRTLLADAIPSEEAVCIGALSVAVGADGSIFGLKSNGELEQDEMVKMADLALGLGKEFIARAEESVASSGHQTFGFLGET